MSKNNLNNVVGVTSLDVPELLTIFRKHGKVPGFLGAPGVGKTASIKQWAIEEAARQGKTFVECPTIEDWDNPNNFCYSVVLTSQIEEIDSRGLPHVVTKNDNEQVTVYTLTELFPKNGCGVIVLDEFPNGRTQVQNAMQPMILEHKAGSMLISKDIQFIVAGNRQSDNCGTHFIPAALRNRVFWYEVSKPSVGDWLDKMEEIGRPINPRMAAWMLSVGAKFYDNFDPRAEQYAYGTTRSVHQASEIIDGISDYKMIQKLVGGAIGEDAGMEFVSFLKLTETVDVNALLKDPKEIHKYEDNLGLLYSISITLIDKFVDTIGSNEAILDVIMETKRKEHGMFILKGTMNKLGKAKFIERLTKCKNAKNITNKYYQLLKGEEVN